jgi:hypothetical protein
MRRRSFGHDQRSCFKVSRKGRLDRPHQTFAEITVLRQSVSATSSAALL